MSPFLALRSSCLSRLALPLATMAFFGLSADMAAANGRNDKREAKATVVKQAPQSLDAGGVAEARLIEIYNLIGQGAGKDAFLKAEQLATDLPNFQLAQLVYGDLLVARTRPVSTLGDVPAAMAKDGSNTLKELREESLKRVKALKERPVPGTIPV
jgi:L,D-transpeptidase YnhG